MSDTIKNVNEIPVSPFYVTCKDTFMSGWGRASGLDNTLILPCDTLAEAEIVKDNAEGRGDQINVIIHQTKPRLRSHGVLYSLFNRISAPRWYQIGSWVA